jgi:hypothetical protein
MIEDKPARDPVRMDRIREAISVLTMSPAPHEPDCTGLTDEQQRRRQSRDDAAKHGIAIDFKDHV